MSGETVVPFASSTKYWTIDKGSWWCKSHNRAATHMSQRPDGSQRHCCNPALGGIMLPCECEELPGDKPDVSAVENILRAMEGMQTQVQALTDLVIAQDARIAELEKEKAKRSKII